MRPLLLAALALLHAFAVAQDLTLQDVARLPAPAILHSETAAADSITVRHIVFRSIDIGGVPNEVYAVVAAPKGAGPHPALLILHPGRASAQNAMAEEWARKGYVAISPDLPGIADPVLAPRSGGTWKQQPYGSNRWTVSPTLAHSTVFQSLAAGTGAVHLLRGMNNVDPRRIGIIGASWGSYMTTVLAGLLGDDIRAAYAVWGGGFFEDTVFADNLAGMSDAERSRWQSALGAENYLSRISARFFIAGASNDRAFYLPSLVRTYENIAAPKSIVFGPNADHDAGGYAGGPPLNERNWTAQEVTFFDHALKGIGLPLPNVDAVKIAPQFAEVLVNAEAGLRELALFHAPANAPWPKRQWKQLAAGRIKAIDGKHYRIDLSGLDDGAWFVIATDLRGVSASSLPKPLAGQRL
jgi:dienelactone hydrolase